MQPLGIGGHIADLLLVFVNRLYRKTSSTSLLIRISCFGDKVLKQGFWFTSISHTFRLSSIMKSNPRSSKPISFVFLIMCSADALKTVKAAFYINQCIL